MPGRPRKPYDELEASGAFKKDPKRREKRDKEPSPESGIGGAPSDIGKEVKNAWRTIVGWDSRGVLSREDRGLVTVAALLYKEIKCMDRDGVLDNMKAISEFRQVLGSMGMTPVSHHRVKPRKKTPVSANLAPVKKDFRSNVIGFKPPTE